jgi:gamma-glutamylcyclotransferase (GGCT)/AIG2-like uncharacterized protein YtfP
MTNTQFFVSGSFYEGHVHWSKISQFVQSSKKAVIKASAWRLKSGYPVILDDGMDLIKGLLVTLKSSEILVSLLDEFHGYNQFDAKISLFVRRKVTVLIDESSESEQAWAYFLNPQKLPTDAAPIHEGKWQDSLSNHPPLVSALTERQRTYLTKLAAASGREIVPINDLSLYRELMKLELIVDKGRRLALSKLGHEVVRYIG